MRYELTDYEWTTIKPFLPNKPRGVPRLNDRRVLNPKTRRSDWQDYDTGPSKALAIGILGSML
jgi:hypothetical protein